MNGWPVERSLPIWYNQCKATLSTSTSTLCLWKATSNSLYVTLWKCPSKSIQTFRWKITLPFSPLPAHCMMVSTRPGSEQNCCSDHSCQWSKLSLFGKALVSWGMFSVPAPLRSALWFSSKSVICQSFTIQLRICIPVSLLPGGIHLASI